MVAQTCKRAKKGARFCCVWANAERVIHHSHHKIVKSQYRNQKLFREKSATALPKTNQKRSSDLLYLGRGGACSSSFSSLNRHVTVPKPKIISKEVRFRIIHKMHTVFSYSLFHFL